MSTQARDDDVPATAVAPQLPASARRLLDGAVESFAARGFQATTTRDISQHAKLSPGALYVHFESKEHVLFELVRSAHDSLLAELRRLPEPTPGHELDLVVAQIEAVTRWHVDNHLLARVAQHELPHLSEAHLATVREQRRAVEDILTAPVAAGCAAGVFRRTDPRLFLRAMLSLTVDVIRWYSPGGRYTADDLAKSNVDILTAYLLSSPSE